MASASSSKTFPGFSNAYVLEEGNYTTFRGEISLDDTLAVTRAEEVPREPVEVRWVMGRRKPSDIIYTTSAHAILISDRVVDILKAGEFSGWRTYPIVLLGKDGERIPGYHHGLAVHGRCGPVDDNRSVALKKIYPARVSTAWYGLYFDPATWDGSDLFMPADNRGWIIVVEAVKRAFEKAKVKNVTFTSLDAVERPALKLTFSRR